RTFFYTRAPVALRPSAAPRRPAAGVALEAGAVADHGEIAAFGAGFADVAFHPRFGALLGDGFDLGREARANAKRGALGKLAFERGRALDEALRARPARDVNRLPCPRWHQHQLVGLRAHEAPGDDGGVRRAGRSFAEARRLVLIDAAAKNG